MTKLANGFPGPVRSKAKLDTPIIAAMLSINTELRNGFLVANASQNEAKFTNADRIAKRLGGLGALSGSTKRVVGASFTHNPQFGFGHGGAHPNHVNRNVPPSSSHTS